MPNERYIVDELADFPSLEGDDMSDLVASLQARVTLPPNVTISTQPTHRWTMPDAPVWRSEPVYAPAPTRTPRRRTRVVEPEPEELWRQVEMDTEYEGVDIEGGYGYWTYTFTFTYQGRSGAFPYRERTRQGDRNDPGRMPTLRTIVNRGVWAERWGYEDWCSNFERRTDCVKSRRLHAEAQEQAALIRTVLGDDYQQIANELGVY